MRIFRRHAALVIAASAMLVGGGTLAAVGARAASAASCRTCAKALPPGSSGSYNSLPWRIGLLTQTNSTC